MQSNALGSEGACKDGCSVERDYCVVHAARDRHLSNSESRSRLIFATNRSVHYTLEGTFSTRSLKVSKRVIIPETIPVTSEMCGEHLLQVRRAVDTCHSGSLHNVETRSRQPQWVKGARPVFKSAFFTMLVASHLDRVNAKLHHFQFLPDPVKRS